LEYRKTIAEQIKDLRKELGLTQADLADRCNLDIRTIQRIESGKVKPRAYTIGLINGNLNNQIEIEPDDLLNNARFEQYQNTFKKRRTARYILVGTALFTLLIAFLLLLLDVPKMYFAPVIYILMFAHLIAIGLIWRCPYCNGLLGDVFNTRYCSKCGFRFYLKPDDGSK
jgi:transcriptional regulator with XRE-family HTH domain